MQCTELRSNRSSNSCSVGIRTTLVPQSLVWLIDCHLGSNCSASRTGLDARCSVALEDFAPEDAPVPLPFAWFEILCDREEAPPLDSLPKDIPNSFTTASSFDEVVLGSSRPSISSSSSRTVILENFVAGVPLRLPACCNFVARL